MVLCSTGLGAEGVDAVSPTAATSAVVTGDSCVLYPCPMHCITPSPASPHPTSPFQGNAEAFVCTENKELVAVWVAALGCVPFLLSNLQKCGRVPLTLLWGGGTLELCPTAWDGME